jgi:hypothetical protein
MDCGFNFRGKKQRFASVYLCSGYNNNKSECQRFIIKEGELDEIVEKHKWIMRENNEKYKDLSDEEYVKRINVHNKEEGYIIKYQDGTESIMSRSHVKF